MICLHQAPDREVGKEEKEMKTLQGWRELSFGSCSGGLSEET